MGAPCPCPVVRSMGGFGWVLVIVSLCPWACGAMGSVEAGPAAGASLSLPQRALATPLVAAVLVHITNEGGAQAGPCGTPGAPRPCASLQSALHAFRLWVVSNSGVADTGSGLAEAMAAYDVHLLFGPGSFGSGSCNVSWPFTRSLHVAGSGPGPGPNATTIDCQGEARVLQSSSPTITVSGLALRACAGGQSRPPSLSGGCLLVVWDGEGPIR